MSYAMDRVIKGRCCWATGRCSRQSGGRLVLSCSTRKGTGAAEVGGGELVTYSEGQTGGRELWSLRA